MAQTSYKSSDKWPRLVISRLISGPDELIVCILYDRRQEKMFLGF